VANIDMPFLDADDSTGGGDIDDDFDATPLPTRQAMPVASSLNQAGENAAAPDALERMRNASSLWALPLPQSATKVHSWPIIFDGSPTSSGLRVQMLAIHIQYLIAEEGTLVLSKQKKAECKPTYAQLPNVSERSVDDSCN
jgi:hypothetical protein